MRGEHVEGEELLEHWVVGLVHLSHGAKEAGLSLVQEDDAVGQLTGQAHVVGDDDAGEVKLGLEAANQVGEEVPHQRVDHGGGLVIEDGYPGLRGQRAGDGD